MYLHTWTVKKLEKPMSLSEAKQLAMNERLLGRGSEIISDDEARRRGLIPPMQMQDLSKINSWLDIK